MEKRRRERPWRRELGQRRFRVEAPLVFTSEASSGGEGERRERGGRVGRSGGVCGVESRSGVGVVGEGGTLRKTPSTGLRYVSSKRRKMPESEAWSVDTSRVQCVGPAIRIRAAGAGVCGVCVCEPVWPSV